MIGGNLMPALLAPPSDTLLVTPPLGFSSFGPGGGPFTVTSQTYTLKNTGSTPLNWSLVNTSSWLTVSSDFRQFECQRQHHAHDEPQPGGE